MRETGLALVVSPEGPRREAWMDGLRLAGFDVMVCPGPGRTLDCPRVHGIACTMRERADVAVVDLDADDEAEVCTKLLDDGTTVFVRGRGPAAAGVVDVRESVVGAIAHVRALDATADERDVTVVDVD